MTGNVTTTYSWSAAGQLLTTTVNGQPTTLYTYDQRGNLTVAVTNGLTTTFVYNGHNQRLQLTVSGQTTTYLLDYARGGNRVLQESNPLQTKFYLYGDHCLAELVETDNPERPEQRFYLYDGSQTVRQTVNEQAEPTYAWTFSPEGAVLLGEEGPVSHLSCVGDAVYDWSTGLIYKNGRYYDPRSDLWLTFSSPAMVWAAHRLGGKPDKRRNKKQDKRFFWLLFLLLVLFVLAGCSGGEMSEAEKRGIVGACPAGTPENPLGNTNLPEPSEEIVLLFGGSLGDEELALPGPDVDEYGKLPVLAPFYETADDFVPYPGAYQDDRRNANGNWGKLGQAENMGTSHDNQPTLLIGYSAGADASLIYADMYMIRNPSHKSTEWTIKGIALLGPTMTGDMQNGENLGSKWISILDNLLEGGTNIYLLDDDAEGDNACGYTPPAGAKGKFEYVYRPNQQHYPDPEDETKLNTNNSIEVRNEIMNWLISN